PYTEGFTTTSTPAGWNTTGWTIGANHGVTGNGIYKNLYDSTGATSGQFTSGPVGVLGSNDELKFDYRVLDWVSPYPGSTVAPTGNWGNFTVQISTDCGTNFTTLGTVNSSNHTANGQSFSTKSYNLAAYAGQNVIFRIVATWTSGDYYLDMDNFSIAPTPSCPAPNDFVSTAVGPESGSFSWTGSGDFELQYGPTGFTVGSGTTQVVTGATTATISGLTTNQAYQVYVRKSCGAGEYSTWAGPISITPNNDVIYNAGPIGSQYVAAPTNTTVSSCPATMSITVPAGKRIASLATQYSVIASSVNDAYMSEQRSYIYSPTLSVGEATVVSGTGSSAGTMNYSRALTFANGATGTISFELRVFRTYEGVAGCNTDMQVVPNGSWKLIPVFEDIPGCPEPTALGANSIAETNAILTWTSEGTSFDIEYGVAPFTPTG
ncbi:MAG TPA: hypothetical protein PLA69_09570, partial [Flavobacterium sp.]|nr:hypothetical protein [Flavobacterium sp.]